VTPTETTLARADEATEVVRCFWESLREPAFTSALVRLVSVKGLREKSEIAGRSQLEASATNGKGPLVVETLAAPHSAITLVYQPSSGVVQSRQTREIVS
jgi:hypothetical protein